MIYTLFFLPGVFIHELSHFLVGLFLNAKPVSFSIIPSKKKKSAGHVSFKNITFYNAFPTAIAPTIVGPYLVYLFHQNYLNLYIDMYGNTALYIFIYVTYTVFNSCLPSNQDIKVIFYNPLSILFYGSLIYGTYYYVNL